VILLKYVLRMGVGPWVRDSLKFSMRVVATQTEKFISLLSQFFFCLVAIVDYR
jgi:hypothetical protein